MGYLLLVIIPAICDEKGGPFGGGDACHNKALSYSSFSFALSGVFFWTYTYRMMQKRSIRYKELEIDDIFKVPNRDLDTNAETHLLSGKHDRNQPIEVSSSIYIRDNENQIILDQGSSSVSTKLEESFWDRMVETSRNVAGLMTPPAIATLLGFLFGMVKWLRNLIIGDNAPLRVVTDSVHILGSGTTSCITILLGASLTQGMQSSSVKPLTLFCILIARPFLLPAIGLFVVKAAAKFGLIPVDPLFQYVLVMQYAMPPAMNISTMVQLFDIGVEESSVMLLWSYGIAPISLTAWSTLLLWLFS
ncbi:hypothetical protein RIF29_14045 [Crotalaria pallida]|uniref:Auxin efflux carrier n=1 Tax=Crotalaria pallida TaxID=3830 RepID=A0AAN9FB18_CROPI